MTGIMTADSEDILRATLPLLSTLSEYIGTFFVELSSAQICPFTLLQSKKLGEAFEMHCPKYCR